MQPDAPPTAGTRAYTLPADLLEQVRGRVRLLAILLLVTFSFDPVLHVIAWTIVHLAGQPTPPEFYLHLGFTLADLAVALASAGLWWIARQGYTSPTGLYTFTLLYQILICFVLAFSNNWQWYLEAGAVPPLTWVPAIILLFPMIVPAPPRAMLAAALLAGAMSPLAMRLLELWGKVTVEADDYLRSVIAPAFAIVCAYWGARVVYGLGREVAAARAMGSYLLEERLGRGGMGEVWRARHRMLARPAAIKLIRGSSSGAQISREAQHRFEQEAQAIARLRSPHTVDLFDFGVAEGGTFYYVMELLEGLDADALVRRFGPVAPERAVFLLRQVCHSLAEAESCGLVHRDIKPANIFLCRYGQDHDFVKVLDFGLVKALDARTGGEAGLTQENVVQGTPAFIAPEQAMGEGDVDARADIYATGCVAYWLLTGQYVFTAETPMGILLHHAQTRPAPPSTRVEAPIPPGLDRLVLACLAKDPTDRPQSARELSRRLGEIELGRPWTADQADAWWEEHLPDRPRVMG
jgi:eukaryotic-like serine/threonine-protein kinase